jgi:hypothetical protein
MLSLVDLGFHELGHLVTYPLPAMVTAAMGSVAQIAVPLGLSTYFWLRRHELPQAAVCMAWAGTSTRGVARYVADAPYERLELIGGDHDWAFFFNELNHLEWSAGTATFVTVCGAVMLIGALMLCAWTFTASDHAPDVGWPGAGRLGA